MTTAKKIYRVETDSPVAFITIDDGYFTDPDADAFMDANPDTPVTQFLTYYAASSGAYPPPTSGPGFDHIQNLRKYQTGPTTEAQRVGCHQKQHLDYRGQSVADQQAAMNFANDELGSNDMFFWRPRLFRSPYGQYDNNTLQAAYSAGMPTVVLWTHAYEQPSLEFTNEYGTPVPRAGDIFCLHHPSQPNMNGYLLQQLQDALSRIQTANLYPAWLHDFL